MKKMVQLSFKESQKLLKDYKIPYPKGFIATTKEQATLYGVELRFPVVMKIASEKILHKTDVNGVKIDIKSREEAVKTFNEMMLSFGDSIDGVLVQKMVQGTYVFIGMKRDPQFGPVIAFGLGGIFVEVLKDVTFRIAPITRDDAREMIQEIKAYPMLAGARGKEPVNLKLLEKILVRVSKLAMKEEAIQELDLNPVVINKDDAYAVDARFIA